MKERLERIKEIPAIAHLLRAVTRYGTRLGGQMAAAITYFSVLAIIPILMLAVAVVGFLTTEIMPAWQDQASAWISAQVGAANTPTSAEIQRFVQSFLGNYRSIGIIGFLAAAYAGAGWVGNLKQAVRFQTQPSLETETKDNPVVQVFLNLGILLGLLFLIALTLGLSATVTLAGEWIITQLGFAGSLPAILLTRAVALIGLLGASWVLFMFCFSVLPDRSLKFADRAKGAVLAAAVFTLLTLAAGQIVQLFSGNAAIGVFGPIITLMLFMNLFAQLILFVTAWMATGPQPFATEPEEPAAAAEPEIPLSRADRIRARTVRAGDAQAARLAATPADGTTEWQPGSEHSHVKTEVAARSVRIGMGAGYVTGAATGIGLGALVAAVVGWLGRRRKSS